MSMPRFLAKRSIIQGLHHKGCIDSSGTLKAHGSLLFSPTNACFVSSVFVKNWFSVCPRTAIDHK